MNNNSNFDIYFLIIYLNFNFKRVFISSIKFIYIVYIVFILYRLNNMRILTFIIKFLYVFNV